MSNNVLFQIRYSAKNPPRNLPADKKLAYVQERQFFDWTAPYNYISYTLNEKKVEKFKDFRSYASREGNLGLFCGDKVYTKEDLAEIKEQLKNIGSHIWHGFISFDEETSPKFQVQDQAMHFLKQHFTDFINRTHLNADNICVVASLHRDTLHRHIHFSFFEKEPTHVDKNGKVGYTTKGNFNQSVIDNWLVSANMAVAGKDDYYSSRNAVISKLKEMKGDITDQEMQLKLLSLAKKFPKEGRWSYNSENMAELRPEIDKLATFILCSQPEVKKLHTDFLRQLAARNKKVEGIKSDNNIRSQIDYVKNLRKDYKARVGNLVIALAREMRKQYKPAYYKKTSKQKKYEARDMRRHAARVYRRATATDSLIKMLGNVQKGVQAEFTNTVKDVEYMMMQEMMMQGAQA